MLLLLIWNRAFYFEVFGQMKWLHHVRIFAVRLLNGVYRIFIFVFSYIYTFPFRLIIYSPTALLFHFLYITFYAHWIVIGHHSAQYSTDRSHQTAYEMERMKEKIEIQRRKKKTIYAFCWWCIRFSVFVLFLKMFSHLFFDWFSQNEMY